MPPRGQSYYEVLTEAINDMVENGFDSMERVQYWTMRLRQSISASLIPHSQMEEALRVALQTVYRRMVEQGGIVKFHPGVGRFTLEKVRPQLRAELDRRIMASANLIKLNRARAVEQTLQRFEGWATSIPKGGTDAAKKSQVKAEQRKALVQLPFEERRVIIDQSHKLTASISETLAKDGNALAALWHSHYRQPGYDYRVHHKERDGQVYLMRDTWALNDGLIKPGPAGYYDGITAAGEEVYCRCYIQWLYNLRDLPEEMLTAKGKAKLAEVQRMLA